jgi:hypothetical protein
MKQETIKERWVAAVIDSLEGIDKARAPEHVYEDIITRIGNVRPSTRVYLKRWAIAAAILLVANGLTAYHYLKQHSHSANQYSLTEELNGNNQYNY